MKQLIFILLLLSMLFQCTNTSMIEEGKLSISPGACFPEVSDKYVYPVTPGMKEWQTSDDVYKLVQLPVKVLKTISTPGLIDALVNSPLFTGSYLLSSSSSPVDTWNRHYERFNCAKELFQRKDAGNALVSYYNLVCFHCFELSADSSEIKEQIMGLEFLFTKQEILDKITHNKKQESLTALIKNYEQKPDEIYRVFPMAWIMYGDKYVKMEEYYQGKAELLQTILNGYVSPSDDQIDLIISFAKSFINDKN